MCVRPRRPFGSSGIFLFVAYDDTRCDRFTICVTSVHHVSLYHTLSSLFIRHRISLYDGGSLYIIPLHLTTMKHDEKIWTGYYHKKAILRLHLGEGLSTHKR